jgi:hypothetical protein
MVEQDVLDALAEEAPSDPEKVQVVARFSSVGAAVGSGAGAARTRDANRLERMIKLQRLGIVSHESR